MKNEIILCQCQEGSHLSMPGAALVLCYSSRAQDLGMCGRFQKRPVISKIGESVHPTRISQAGPADHGPGRQKVEGLGSLQNPVDETNYV